MKSKPVSSKKSPQKSQQKASVKSTHPVLNPTINYSLVSKLSDLKNSDGVVYYFDATLEKNRKKNIEAIVESHSVTYQKEALIHSDKKTIHFMGNNGPIWIIFEPQKTETQSTNVHFEDSSYAYARDQFGPLVSQFKNLNASHISIVFQSASDFAIEGAIVGLELASYQFLKVFKNSNSHLESSSVVDKNGPANFSEKLTVEAKISQNILEAALLKAASLQIAKHLVNLPPNLVNPATIENFVKELPLSSSVQINVWDEKKCADEGMDLLLAVGAGSPTAPRMIHIQYRPKNGPKKQKKPIAFVGKGITFDTGGLDIKPSSGMRLMKKDMGGAAAVLGLAYWVDQSNYHRPCDFYLALAENSVDGFSMRPSDIYRSRKGYLVEIDNTDAEGRLVLADVIDVALNPTKTPTNNVVQPEILVDIATLTGAIKVALGTDIAGLFSNDDELAQQLMIAGQRAGDYNWRMPLYQKYMAGLNSSFADFKNSADGFGGAITAALFLQKFIHQVKWAHLDIYAWSDKTYGAQNGGTASGQPIQALIQWLKTN